MKRPPVVLLCLALGLGGCDLVGKLPSLPSLAVTNVLPRNPDGSPQVIQVGGSSLAMDLLTRDALTALAECVDSITYCTNHGTAPDDCVSAVTQCQGSPLTSDKPCCPKACVQAYAQSRKSGSDPVAAIDAVFFQSHQCFPEVAAMPGVSP